MRKLFLLILLFPNQLSAQTCDSLDNSGITYGVPLKTLEYLVNLNCDRAKLSYAYELLNGYRIKKDTIRALDLLNDCKDRSLDCKYELFQFYYENNPEKAYQLISEISLHFHNNNYYDSAHVVNARLIAADMAENGIGNQEGLTRSATWYLLYYEIEHALHVSETKHMIKEMIRVLKTVDADQLDIAYKNAETILGKKPVFNRNMIN